MKMKLSKDDKFYEIKLPTLNGEKNQSLEAAENFEKILKDKRKKELFMISSKGKKKHIETVKLKACLILMKNT